MAKVLVANDEKVLMTNGKGKSVLVIGKATGDKFEKLDKATRKLIGKVKRKYGKRV